jgi:flavin reductase (DIM6/NTAB) family NADH-FMN oxidoreductase RutF
VFYETARNDHGMKRDPFKAIVAPRPIGWISSMGADGEINLAPYSFFNAVSDRPPIVMFSCQGPKDSLVFIQQTGEFVCNLASFDLLDRMVGTGFGFPRGVNEMERSGLAAAESRLVRVPRVAASPCALECKLIRVIALEDSSRNALSWRLVLGQVVGVHVDDRYIRQGRIDTAAMQPMARCGYDDYAVLNKVFEVVGGPASSVSPPGLGS